jgi:adenylate cyclase class 2
LHFHFAAHRTIMHYEVEMKFHCDDLTRVRNALAALGAAAGEVVEQVDGYYGHPSRDFAKTDEALRLRRAGDRNVMTYKGPKIDATTKTRYELEVHLADGEKSFRAADAILKSLGFAPVASVQKRRQTMTMERERAVIEAAIDDVANVGMFVELEASIDADRDDATALESAKRILAELAADLGLRDSERRSYLELLLASRT